jgi:tetratricopeptide (TPR) repeat protein
MRPIAAVAAFALLNAAARGQAIDRTEVFDLFSQAKELFRQANEAMATNPDEARDLYRRAAMRFERIAGDGGVRNGRLYYNIGNAWFRMGHLGRAILNYRRALLYAPNDSNLQQNLSYARSKRRDRVEPKAETRVLRTLFFWHHDLGTRTRLVLFAVAFGAVWALAGLMLFRRGTALRWGLVVAVGLSVLLLGSLAIEAAVSSRTVAGVVLADEVVARKGDAETFQASFKEPLHAGTEFDVVEDRGEWLQVDLADGRRCWLPRQSVGLVR